MAMLESRLASAIENNINNAKKEEFPGMTLSALSTAIANAVIAEVKNATITITGTTALAPSGTATLAPVGGSFGNLS